MSSDEEKIDHVGESSFITTPTTRRRALRGNSSSNLRRVSTSSSRRRLTTRRRSSTHDEEWGDLGRREGDSIDHVEGGEDNSASEEPRRVGYSYYSTQSVLWNNDEDSNEQNDEEQGNDMSTTPCDDAPGKTHQLSSWQNGMQYFAFLLRAYAMVYFQVSCCMCLSTFLADSQMHASTFPPPATHSFWYICCS
mmetsp:Transcript_26629/g.49439  ORF Transcript_26629/g.49439 Transcript_26629/m.49439 type:complete len:193 (-) Transcript_26629:165-743(-)